MSPKKIALVLGSFHRQEVERMRNVAHEVAKQQNLEIMEEVWVHGSLEKPLALKRLLLNPDISGAVALGIIERGETKHGLVMGQAVVTAILSLQLELMKPVGMGILGPEILPEQIEPRLEPYTREAVLALSEMLK
jgi:6,7-dimethyl-8-ribityllumazine synthase